MYTQTQQTLPPITAISNGVDSYNPNSLANGIKQEQEFESPSLPPILSPTPVSHHGSNKENSNSSRMSINQLCNDIDTTESDYPEEMKAAAAVLENMKTTLPSIANISSQPQPLEPPTHAEPSQLQSSPSTEAGFMSRLGEISIVKKTMNVYEKGKSNSPFLKYTTEMVESSVSRFSKPVMEHIDSYARSLNKNDKVIDNEGKYKIENDDTLENDTRKRRVRGSEISRSSSPSYRNPSRSHRTSQSSGSSNSTSYAPYTYPNNNSTISATTSTPYSETRSRWQRMVIGTGTAVGAAGAAVSEESMKSLKYCQEWINYATQHIDAQIAVLKEFIVNLTNPSQRAVVHTSSSSTLASIKKEVVETLRKVIEVISQYAGACLPDQARTNVRSFILSLPSRWASINHTEHSSSPSPMSSPQLAPANGHPLNQTSDYARRLLSLATESLEMLKSVAGIFGETIGIAEAWVETFRSVGMTSSITTQSNGYGYSSSNTSSHSSPGSRSRRLSNSVRASNHGQRKISRPTSVHPDDDDDSILNGHHDSDSSSDSDDEQPMRMEMDNAQKRALKNANIKSQQHANGALNGIKKRKKGGKKGENDRMDLS